MKKVIEKREPGSVVVLAQSGNSFIQGQVGDDGEFYAYDVYFGDNFTLVSVVAEQFPEVIELFKKLAANKTMKECRE